MYINNIYLPINRQLLSNVQVSAVLQLLIRDLIVGGRTGFASGRLNPVSRCLGLRLSADEDSGPVKDDRAKK